MRETTMGEILGDFCPTNVGVDRAKDTCFITIRVSPEAKARYEKIQESSGRRFSKKAREALLALIEAAEARTA